MKFIHEKGIIHYLEGENKLGYFKVITNGDIITINTVFVYEEYRNKGIASQMMKEFYNYLKQKSQTVIPVCPYAVTWFKRNKDKVDILDPAYKSE